MAEVILIIITLFQIAFMVFLGIFFLYFLSSIFVWPPSIPTDGQIRREIVKMIQQKYDADANIKIIDLGCGYGHLVRTISRNFKNAEVTGVELLWLPYLFSKLIFFRNKRIKIEKGNLYDFDISQYDVMIYFLRKNHRVDQLLKNAKNDAVVISNNFPLKRRPATEVKEIKDIFAVRRIYFYQL